MNTKPLSEGSIHTLPPDLKAALLAAPQLAHEKWESITPLARSEWICWVEGVKKQETRDEHIRRVSEELMEGKRRPCCWTGCPHRPGATVWVKGKGRVSAEKL